MLKKRVALFLAAIMVVTSVDSSMLTVAAQEVPESVEETSLQETEVIEELFAEEMQENTENITAEEVTENAEGWETETEEIKENEGVSEETESDTEVSAEEEFDDTEVLIDNSAEVMEAYEDAGTSGLEDFLDDSYIYCGEFKNAEKIINSRRWGEKKYYYRFVPEEDGKYVFFKKSWSGEALTYMNIFYEKDESIIEMNSHSYQYTLSADTTYYFYHHTDYSYDDTSTVWIEKVPEIVSVEAGAVQEKDFIIALYRNDYDLRKKFLDGFELKITYSDNSVATIALNGSYSADRYDNKWDAMIQSDEWTWYSYVPDDIGLGKHDVKITGPGMEEPLLFTVNVKTPSEAITSVIEEGTQTVQAGSEDGEYIFYKWNPIKGKRYCFSNMDEENMCMIFFRINENGTYTEENYDRGRENYCYTLNEQYYVGFRAWDGEAASWEVKVETVPMISSIEVLDKSKVTFIKKLESADLRCMLKIQLDNGTTREVFFDHERSYCIYVDEFNNLVRVDRFKLDEQGQYNLKDDLGWEYSDVGKYVFHIYASYQYDNESWNWRKAATPYVDVPYEIVEAESANLEKLENDKENAVEMTKGYALYSFTPEKSGMYAVTSNLNMDLITVRDANRRNYKLWNNKYSAYAMLTGGETYYIKVETSSQYEQARLEIHKVKEITELSVNAEKKEYLADFETFDPAKTQTKVTFEDGSSVTLSGYDSVENAMLYYKVSKEHSKKNWSDELLESGEYTVTPWWSWNTTGSGVKVKDWNPTIKTDTIRAVPMDTDHLSSLTAEIWNDITMTGEVGYYTFTAEKEGIYILESNLDEYTQGSLYQKDESGWQECGNEIRMEAGEECVIKLGKAENLQVCIHFDEEVRKRITKTEVVPLREKIYEYEDLQDVIAIDVTYEDGTRLTERLKRVYNDDAEIEYTAYDVYGNLFHVEYDEDIYADGYFIKKCELEYYDYDNLQVAVETVPFDVKCEYTDMLPEITEGKILSADLQSGRQYYKFVPEKTGEYVFKLNLLEHAYHHITVDEYNEYDDERGWLDEVSSYSASFDDASGYMYELKAGQCYVVTWEATTDVTETENATLTLSRMKKTVKDVTVSKEPDNKEIFRQQTAAMCLSGLEVEVTYSDGSTEKVAYGKTDSEGRKLVLSDEVRLNGQTKRIYVSFGSYRVSVDLNIVGVDQLQTLTEGQTYTFAMAPEAYKYVRFEPEKTGKYYIDHSESGYYYCTCENDGTIVVRTSDGCCSLEKGKTYTFLVHSADPEGGIVRLGAYLHDTHSWNSGMVTKKATCKENGIRTYQCTVCSATKTDKIPVTNIHDFTKSTWTVTKEATAVAEGTKERTCSVCKKAKETQKTAKLKATYKLNVSGTVLLQCGKSFTLKVTGLAKGDRVVSWSSSNTKIATVKNGVVKAAKKTGSVTITIKLASDTVIRQTVKVQKAAVKVSSMAVAKTMWSVKQGETIRIVPTSFAPVTATSKTVTYSTSDKKVATVTSKGVVKGIAGGTAKITLKCGSAKVVCTVKVEPVKTKSIKLNKTTVSLKKKKTLTLKVTRTPKASTEKITFKSSDTKVATVNANGKITAKKAGTAVITVTCGSAKATCTVTVK